jgi:hypothetical protein
MQSLLSFIPILKPIPRNATLMPPHFYSSMQCGLVISQSVIKAKSSHFISTISSTQYATLSIPIPASIIQNTLLLGQDFQAGERSVDSVESQQERALDLVGG